MTLIGQYDPEFSGVSGDLFVYGESPVTSLKLNRWSGNLEHTLKLLHLAARLMADDSQTPLLLGTESQDPFRVRAQATADLTVRVLPGIVLAGENLIGLGAEARVPATGAFISPTTNPRIDAVGVKPTGEWVVVEGTEAASPEAPDLEEGEVLLAEVYLRVGASSIEDTDDFTNGYLLDRRPSRLFCKAHRHTGPEVPAETADGTRTEFSTSGVFAGGSLRVYVNGLQQIPGTHYDEDSDREGYTFATAPPAGYAIHHEYQAG